MLAEAAAAERKRLLGRGRHQGRPTGALRPTGGAPKAIAALASRTHSCVPPSRQAGDLLDLPAGLADFYPLDIT